jgi:hypothetical protein
MTMLTCDDAIQLIGPAVEATLSPALADRLDEHLRHCPRCQVIETQRRIRAVLSMRPDDVLPAGFEARMFARLDAERPLGWLEMVNWRTWSMCLLPAATAVLVIAVSIGRLTRPAPTVTDSLARMLAQGSIADTLFDRDDGGERWMDDVLFGRERRVDRRTPR